MFDEEAWRKAETHVITLRYMKSNEDFKAMKRAVKMDSLPTSKWIKQAIHEKLERDGWLSEGKLPKGKLVK